MLPTNPQITFQQSLKKRMVTATTVGASGVLSLVHVLSLIFGIAKAVSSYIWEESNTIFTLEN